MPKFDRKSASAFGHAGGIGLELAAFFLIGVKGGAYLDHRFGTTPIWSRIGLAFGIFSGFYLLWKLTRKPSARPPQAPSDT